jgi:AcrR family transcriptional regulator
LVIALTAATRAAITMRAPKLIDTCYNFIFNGAMAQREQAKEQKRARIRAAAAHIIRTGGIEQLTMRRLAEQAGVSLRTPYNLIGSKTDVLIALIEEAGFDPRKTLTATDNSFVTERLLGALDQIEQFFDSDESFYREVYGGIMASDHPDIRESGVGRVVETCQLLMHQAAALGELKGDTNTEQLGRHLGIQLLAVLGMWGSGFFTNQESIRQVKRAWCGVLLQHCGDTLRPQLEAAYRSALRTEG